MITEKEYEAWIHKIIEDEYTYTPEDFNFVQFLNSVTIHEGKNDIYLSGAMVQASDLKTARPILRVYNESFHLYFVTSTIEKILIIDGDMSIFLKYGSEHFIRG